MPPRTHQTAPGDRHGRPLDSLRLSITDRCNLRCTYCMPGEDYTWLPSKDVLTFEEILRLTGLFADIGVTRLRLTGGEPLLRRDADKLVHMLCAADRFEEVAMTTNGLGLPRHARALKDAGLSRLTVSLDSLRRERVERLSGRDSLDAVLAGLDAAAAVGFTGTKLDTVVVNGVNDDELVDFLVFGAERELEVRFIEYMDVPGALEWRADEVLPRAVLLERVARAVGAPVEPLGGQGSAPAARYRLGAGARVDGRDLSGRVFGVIASTTEPFCAACDRARVTADGHWYLCLYAEVGLDLLALLRGGITDDELRERLRLGWGERDDRGAERRLEQAERGAFEASVEAPHLEMHRRGG